MRRPIPAIGLAAILIAAAVCCSAASAKEPRFAARFKLPASHGYELTFTGHTGGERATITVARRGQRARYEVGAQVLTRSRIRASFGRFGEIDVRFEPGGRSAQRGCPKARYGTFRGTIAFEGDNGFTSAQALSAEGAVKRGGFGPPIPCFSRAGPDRDSMDDFDDLVFLLSCDEHGKESYAAIEGLGPRTAHVAELHERIGRVSIGRWRLVNGESSTFRHDEAERTARVRPPSPFRGAAVLRKGRLTGDLAVPLPGETDPTRLTPAPAGIRAAPRSCNRFIRNSFRAAARLSGA